MKGGRRLAVVGTLVWDRIFDPEGRLTHEGWGGISYAVSALAAVIPDGWTIVPMVKVGRDRETEARAFFDWLVRAGGSRQLDTTHLVPVEAANNRVELRYHDNTHRSERLTGGVPPWSAEELLGRVAGCDALLVNFISGQEMSLETAKAVRAGFAGPTYADLHSLLLDMRPDGTRKPRQLDDFDGWATCFDSIQVNETEFELLSSSSEPWRVAEDAVRAGTRRVLVTLGEEGCAWIERKDGERPSRGSVTLPDGPAVGDPTGCGDVWGATTCAHLLAGASTEEAAVEATRVAALNVGHSGVEGLTARLLAGLHEGGRDDRGDPVQSNPTKA